MTSEFERKREEFLAKRREERLKWVGFWADYVRTHSDREWSRQQKNLIDSQIQSARQFRISKETYLKMKAAKDMKN